MNARRQPPQQPPPVQKLRLRYAKRGAARFTSHCDFSRALERALRRADVPMAYSSGFNPHPRISYANAAPTSAASEAEYVELGLAERCDPTKVVEALNDSLPRGFVVLDAADAVPASLGELLEVSDWEVELDGVDEAALARAVSAFLAEESHEVERLTKRGMRRFDARGATLACQVVGGRLRIRIRHETPLVRPDDVVAALRMLEPGIAQHPLLRRLAQGPVEGDGIGDPLRPR
ncbi:TIGR03936 family radical SAM-associated protein [uncultured Tessaracoccus sp.]|uniref:TIGR03936 family radical SAM-associated protein n=1 Tax=uncultured Tessaracoccus sp. TaxID=905023 RepID=UPI0025DF90A4|nr:TIGR03936 family radical SAM-associated protein [uncultured Tessaracoccus sp.]